MSNSLGSFGLPVLRDVPRTKKKKGLRPYIEAAVSFFDYSELLEEPRRKSYLKAIADYREAEQRKELEPEDLGPQHNEIENLLDDLETYIEDHDEQAKQRLLGANFVKVKEYVLGFRKKGTKSRPRIKKVTGTPLEAALTSVWITLADFMKQAAKDFLSPRDEIQEIHLTAEQFKHDCVGETKEEADQHSMKLLEECLGGLDDLLERRVQIELDAETNETVQVISRLTPSRSGTGGIKGILSRSAEPGLIFSVRIVSESLPSIERRFQWRFPETHPFRTISQLFRWAAELGQETEFLPVFGMPYYTELMLAQDEEEVDRILMEAVRKEELRKAYNLLKSPQLPNSDPVRSACKDLAYHYSKLAIAVSEKGFYSGLEQHWEKLRDAYETSSRLFTEEYGTEGSYMGPLLLKAFAIIPSLDDGFDPWEPFLRSAVLHFILLSLR
jgi:DNA phosphorothioation-dependent restriction protein DptH